MGSMRLDGNGRAPTFDAVHVEKSYFHRPMLSAVFTIIAKNYLPHARVLMRSVKEHSPSLLRFVVLIDEPEGLFEPDSEPFTIVSSKDLPIYNSGWFHFKYTVLELSTAVKPYAAQYLFEEHGVDKLIYLDPDILTFTCLSRNILSRLDHANILLTPHLTAELDDGYHPDELAIIKAGSYNLGFIALRKGAVTMAMLEWWQARLYDRCVVSPQDGLFVDQKWMDLVPGIFPGVEVVRDPGWNVAYWNIHSRKISLEGDSWRASGVSLVFFHFSGFDPRAPEFFSRHQNRFKSQDLGEAANLLHGYGQQLFAQGFEQCSTWPYTWSKFEDGFPIPDIARPVHHEDPSLLETFGDPFSATARKAFAAVWNQPSRAGLNGKSQISRLGILIYNLRSDVRSSMPDVLGSDAARFRQWLLTSGAREHGLPRYLLVPSTARPDASKATTGTMLSHSSRHEAVCAVDDEWLMTVATRLDGLRGRLLRSARKPEGRSKRELQDVQAFLNELSEEREPSPPLTRLAHHILLARPDVLESCKTNGAISYGKVYAWLMTFGRSEFHLPDVCTAAIRRCWKQYLKNVSTVEAAVSLGWNMMMSVAVFRREYRLRSRATHAPPIRFAKTHEFRTESQPKGADKPSGLGVTLVGYSQSEMGVGESVRLAFAALEACGVPVQVTTLSTNGAYPDKDRKVKSTNSRRYKYSIVHVNADEFPRVVRESIGGDHAATDRIAYWAWELERFPEQFSYSFQFCREIWTPSEFCRKAIAENCPLPVIRIPHPIQVPIRDADGPAEFGVDPDRFTFLTMFDMLSVYERKNPLATVKAFARALGRMERAELIVKVNSAHHNRPAMEELQAAAAGLPIRFIERTLTRPAVNSLIAASDCFVSLHRSEGFGLALAEAMFLGKPVIATGYSGNVDFMNSTNSFVVAYDMVPVSTGCEPYPAGERWADPSIDDAARLMVEVRRNSARRVAVGKSAQDYIKRTLSVEAVGAMMKKRLEVLERSGPPGTAAHLDGEGPMWAQSI